MDYQYSPLTTHCQHHIMFVSSVTVLETVQLLRVLVISSFRRVLTVYIGNGSRNHPVFSSLTAESSAHLLVPEHAAWGRLVT